MNQSQDFGKIRRLLFPVHRHELSKLIPLILLFLLLSFCYFTLRSLKDIYIIKHINVEAIYYIKLFGVTPGIILLTILYSKISKLTTRDRRFNIVITYFLVFFAAVHYLLIPHIDTFRLDSLANALNRQVPTMTYLWEAIRFWPLALFYIHAEAWGVMAQGVLFWTFVNEITSLEQSKRLYGFLPLGLGVAFLMEGFFLDHLKSQFNLILGFNLVVIVAILLLYNGFTSYFGQELAAMSDAPRLNEKAPKLSLTESFKLIAGSRYLALIASIVLSYGIVTSLLEALWKTKVEEWAAGNTQALVTMYSNQAMVGGILGLLLTIFIATPVMNSGWRFAASVVPVIALIMSSIFFWGLYFPDALHNTLNFFTGSPLTTVVYLGLFVLIFIKIARYTIFDPNKERVYIPLDKEFRTIGKAAVDGLGTRLGKSLGSFIVTTILIPIFGSIAQAKYSIFCVILGTLVFWLRSVGKLSILFEQRTKEHEKQLRR